jgi:hypothetical protein
LFTIGFFEFGCTVHLSCGYFLLGVHPCPELPALTVFIAAAIPKNSSSPFILRQDYLPMSVTSGGGPAFPIFPPRSPT